jgi:ATP-dependent exoDNAse (exonuclease V) alpha subunit
MYANVQSLTSSKDTYYVALSRARREVKIYTNDRERLPEMMARENVKEAALEIHRTLGG